MSGASAHTIPLDRDLSAQERDLVVWLLKHGLPRAMESLPQLQRARVIGQCSCGCPSIDFSIDGVEPDRREGMVVLSDYLWPTPDGPLFGVILHSREGKLACLEVWSVDGLATPTLLPKPEQLLDYGAPGAQVHLTGETNAKQ
jgi:hypothetical protein